VKEKGEILENLYKAHGPFVIAILYPRNWKLLAILEDFYRKLLGKLLQKQTFG